MKSLTNYIFELKSSTYKDAAVKAKKLGQVERAKSFEQAAERSKQLEKQMKQSELKNKVKDLTFNFEAETEKGYFDIYEYQGIYIDNYDNIYLQVCGYNNTTDKYDKEVEKQAEKLAKENGEKLTDENRDDFIEEAALRWGNVNDFSMWIYYDNNNDKVYLGPDYEYWGTYRQFVPKIEDIKRLNILRVKDNKTASTLAKLVKIFNPDTKLTKNDFIK